MPADESLPGTLKRSPKKAQETWLKTHDSAADQYGDGERAHRTALPSLKHSFEKVDDHWEPKDNEGRRIRAPLIGARPRGTDAARRSGASTTSDTPRPALRSQLGTLASKADRRWTKWSFAWAIDRKQQIDFSTGSRTEPLRATVSWREASRAG